MSDSFLWREGDGWSTRFDLMNALSLLEPDKACDDQITLAVYSSEGLEIARRDFFLDVFGTRTVFLRSLLENRTGFGFFAAFHRPRDGAFPLRPTSGDTCVVERNYVGYRRDGEESAPWNYAHGNSYVFAMNPESGKIDALQKPFRGCQIYAPQLRFDDCKAFELAYINPLPSTTEVTVQALRENGTVAETKIFRLSGHQTELARFENADLSLVTIRNASRVRHWRPLVFKYYAGGFDVFHG